MNTSEGPQKAVCLLCSLFTFLRVILAPGGESRAGGLTCRWCLSVVDRRAGTCLWYTGTLTHVGGVLIFIYSFNDFNHQAFFLNNFDFKDESLISI